MAVIFRWSIISFFVHSSHRTVALQLVSRRRVASSFVGCSGLVLSELLAADSSGANSANAACLPGDLSPTCIGVYKVPIDEEILPYVGTKSALERFAPDVERYVPPLAAPKSTAEALKSLKEQRLRADAVTEMITAGKLEEAGILVLELVPKLTLAARVLVAKQMEPDTASPVSAIEDLRQQRLQDQVEMVYVLWNRVDVAIGQGMRGEMGAYVVAQLTILDDVKDAIRALDDLISMAGYL